MTRCLVRHVAFCGILSIRFIPQFGNGSGIFQWSHRYVCSDKDRKMEEALDSNDISAAAVRSDGASSEKRVDSSGGAVFAWQDLTKRCLRDFNHRYNTRYVSLPNIFRAGTYCCETFCV